MFKTIDDNQVVITDNAGNKTVIAPPEDLNFYIGDKLSIDFKSDVSGLNEHYIAVGINHSDKEILNHAVDFFKLPE